MFVWNVHLARGYRAIHAFCFVIEASVSLFLFLPQEDPRIDRPHGHSPLAGSHHLPHRRLWGRVAQHHLWQGGVSLHRSHGNGFVCWEITVVKRLFSFLTKSPHFCQFNQAPKQDVLLLPFSLHCALPCSLFSTPIPLFHLWFVVFYCFVLCLTLRRTVPYGLSGLFHSLPLLIFSIASSFFLFSFSHFCRASYTFSSLPPLCYIPALISYLGALLGSLFYLDFPMCE